MDDQAYLKNLTLLKGSKQSYPNAPAPAILEAFDNRYQHRDYWITFNCPEFTALCPVTQQPDFGHITIKYVPDQRCIESKSLKLYLFAYRNSHTFHEESVNRILDDIITACSPRQAIVQGEFFARGGISIHVDATYNG